MAILSMLLGLVALVIFILVLIKQFQNAGALHGIIGIITCGIWTFIWGWLNAGKLNIRNLMIIWTVIIIINIVLSRLGGGLSYNLGTPGVTTP